MADKSEKPKETRWFFKDGMVEDLIEVLEATKVEYEGRGLDFEGDLAKLYSELRKLMAEKYEPTDFGPILIQVSEPMTPVEEMSKEEFMYQSSAIFKNTSSHVNISCRSEILYRSHVIASYFQTGPM